MSSIARLKKKARGFGAPGWSSDEREGYSSDPIDPLPVDPPLSPLPVEPFDDELPWMPWSLCEPWLPWEPEACEPWLPCEPEPWPFCDPPVVPNDPCLPCSVPELPWPI